MLLNARVSGYLALFFSQEKRNSRTPAETLFAPTFWILIAARSRIADDLVTSTDLLWHRQINVEKVIGLDNITRPARRTH